MNSYLRRAAVVVLALALFLTPVAAARPANRDSSHAFVRIVKQIQKIFGIATNDDLPQPPIPKSDPPATS